MIIAALDSLLNSVSPATPHLESRGRAGSKALEPEVVDEPAAAQPPAGRRRRLGAGHVADQDAESVAGVPARRERRCARANGGHAQSREPAGGGEGAERGGGGRAGGGEGDLLRCGGVLVLDSRDAGRAEASAHLR
jgi:hypothetical protein